MAARGGKRRIAVARGDVEYAFARPDVDRFGQGFADNLQRDADHGKVAAGPGGLLPAFDVSEVRHTRTG